MSEQHTTRESLFSFLPHYESPTDRVRLWLLLRGTAATAWGASYVLGVRR